MLGREASTPIPQHFAEAESLLGLHSNGSLVERADACCVAPEGEAGRAARAPSASARTFSDSDSAALMRKSPAEATEEGAPQAK